MFEALLRKLKPACWKDGRDTLLIRDQKPRLLLPEANREFARLRQDCGGDAIAESNAD